MLSHLFVHYSPFTLLYNKRFLSLLVFDFFAMGFAVGVKISNLYVNLFPAGLYSPFTVVSQSPVSVVSIISFIGWLAYCDLSGLVM